ncbi:MAG: M3 family metallopeptidase [Tenuifilum sp.]|uniref:M3 family metallopeptidase n=1 Tax=Tenuifilum sp. TaxID=2760880 RepID=UPI002B9F4A4E|nr:M3 family metallopeptidase [Tenuifilum sp.]HOK85584.1 M3 family metallopeptidase [Tenuifilum sp.]HON70355.1 M3 family metallopeptidase [Tenuifilum sp.]HOU74342.1 M3 family metallopeptidase [Tenuifilum sp.]HPP89856.1 M3 family metallopeptidase [Tenuifilum sp.]
MLVLLAVSCQEKADKNPLLSKFDTPYQTPPFDKIKHEHYMPALDSAISVARHEIDAIVNNTEEPTFENTIEALDHSGKLLADVSNILFNLNEAETDSVLQQIVIEASPKLTDFSNDINLNPELFKRVKAVWEKRDSLKLTPEQMMLVDKTYKGFVRNGANLSEADKEKYRAISRELSELTVKFNQNVLAETNSYKLHITNEADLAGLPQSLIDAAAYTAKQKGLEGWVITLDYPMYGPFMKYADNRELRKQLYMAYGNRCFKGNEYDNQKIAQRIANLRLELANLLGYPNFATFVLENRMAETPERVNQFLDQLVAASLPAAREEVKEVEEFARQQGFKGKLERWDWSYYSEKLKNAKYSYNEEELKPYFQLEKVIDGVFLLANKLYGLTFLPNGKIPVYHPDVKAYEVYDGSGRFMSVLYLDFFPREGKSGGAWMTSFRSQYRENGKDIRPIVSIVTNFTKPTDKQPSLLTFYEFSTFLHEFGHALHGMLTDCNYSSLSGTSVYRDFVELPSQIMENFAVEKEYLDLFAVHYQTGEKIPQELVQKIIDSRNFQAGYFSLRQLGFGILDMAWHTITKPVTEDVDSFEKKILNPLDVLPPVKGTNMSVTFGHIFEGGYAAGYYGYKWAEVLDADAFELFKEKGIFNREVAQSFRENILSRGGSEHPMTLYKRFRGQEPTIDALLKRSGLKK